MNNHTIQPVSLKEHAQMQFIHQKRLSDALQLQADVNKKNYDQMGGLAPGNFNDNAMYPLKEKRASKR